MQIVINALAVLIVILAILAQPLIAFVWWVYWRMAAALRQNRAVTESPNPAGDITVALVPRCLKGHFVPGQWAGFYVKLEGVYQYCRFEGGPLETEDRDSPLTASLRRWLKLRYFAARAADAWRGREVTRRPPYD